MSKKITVPKEWDDFKIKHVPSLLHLTEQEEISTLAKVKTLSYYTDMTMDELKELPIQQINTPFFHLLEQQTRYTQRTPPQEITLNGEVYVYTEPSEQDAKWFIDFDILQDTFNTSPASLLALVYIEKGKKYGEVKREDREAVFNNHCPAFVFYDVAAFFLSYYTAYLNATTLIVKAKTRTLQRRNKIRSWFMRSWLMRLVNIITKNGMKS
jgi:hypothetical protein